MDDIVIDLSKFSKDIPKEDFEWCKCKEEAMKDAVYIGDGVHPELEKHHWRCTTCDLVVQIG